MTIVYTLAGPVQKCLPRDGSVFGRFLKAIDDKDLDRSFLRHQLQAQFADRGNRIDIGGIGLAARLLYSGIAIRRMSY